MAVSGSSSIGAHMAARLALDPNHDIGCLDDCKGVFADCDGKLGNRLIGDRRSVQRAARIAPNMGRCGNYFGFDYPTFRLVVRSQLHPDLRCRQTHAR